MGRKPTSNNASPEAATPTISGLMPEQGKILLTGTGKQFVERIGLEAIRSIVLAVLSGENIRDQTEPVTRQRITLLSAAMVMTLAEGWHTLENFTDQMSSIAVAELTASRRGRSKADSRPAQWTIGLTDKQVQNVLRDSKTNLEKYVIEFDAVIDRAAKQFEDDYGSLNLTMAFTSGEEGKTINLGWKELARITTAVGSQTLAIRGSDKSMFGKLFEKLILGSTLSILGFKRVDKSNIKSVDKVFWLSDSSSNRESDATLLLRAGTMARFDIGFIGRGNSEVSKDKLSRYEREAEAGGATHSSVTFIIVDTLPAKSNKTQEAAKKIGAEIVQMNWQFWPVALAKLLETRLGLVHEITKLSPSEVKEYLKSKMATMPLQDFLIAVSVSELEAEGDVEDTEIPNLFDEE